MKKSVQLIVFILLFSGFMSFLALLADMIGGKGEKIMPVQTQRK